MLRCVSGFPCIRLNPKRFRWDFSVNPKDVPIYKDRLLAELAKLDGDDARGAEGQKLVVLDQREVGRLDLDPTAPRNVSAALPGKPRMPRF
jgi:hypothetical protein